MTASLAGLLFGFDTVVISGVTQSLSHVFHIEQGGFWYGFSVASGLLGTFVGALFAGVPGDRLGSRDSLKIVGFMYVAAALGCAFCWNIESFYVFRFIGGLAIGASSVLAPVYISELAPADRRGTLTGLFQFNIVFGILVAFASNFIVDRVAPGADLWRLKLGIAGVPATVFALLMYTIPQSPRWLALRGRVDEARASLRRVGIENTEVMLAEFARANEQARREAAEKLFVPAYRRPILLAVLLAMFNQLSGINAILYYLNDIFAAAGFDASSRSWQPVMVAAANLAATMIALTRHRSGRAQEAAAHRLGGHGHRAGLRRADLRHRPGQGVVAGRTHGIHRLLRVFAGRGDLGVPGGDFPDGRAFARPVAGQRHALGHECPHRAGVSHGGGVHARAAIRVLRGLHGAAVLRGAGGFPETRRVELESMDRALAARSGAQP